MAFSALDEGDRPTAEALLHELEPLARTLDGATDRTGHSDEHESRRQRLDGLPG